MTKPMPTSEPAPSLGASPVAPPVEVIARQDPAPVAGLRICGGDVEYGLGLFIVPDEYTVAGIDGEPDSVVRPSDAGTLRVSYGPILSSKPAKSLPISINDLCRFAQALGEVLAAYEQKHFPEGITEQLADALKEMPDAPQSDMDTALRLTALEQEIETRNRILKEHREGFDMSELAGAPTYRR